MLNKVILIGRAGSDPEYRALENEYKVARVNIATSENVFIKSKNAYEEQTEWHSLVFWNKLAERVDLYVKKGTMLYVEGSIRSREWTGKDGQVRYDKEIVVRELRLLAGYRTREEAQMPRTATPMQTSETSATAPMTNAYTPSAPASSAEYPSPSTSANAYTPSAQEVPVQNSQVNSSYEADIPERGADDLPF